MTSRFGLANRVSYIYEPSVDLCAVLSRLVDSACCTDVETAKTTVAEKLQEATNRRADADAAKAVKDKETREAKEAAKSR